MNDYANMLESIRGLASSLHAINQKAVREYTPVAEAILRSPIPDTRHIECVLDGLLDFCGYEPALRLYKNLTGRGIRLKAMKNTLLNMGPGGIRWMSWQSSGTKSTTKKVVS